MSDSDNDSDSLFSYSVITHSSLILPCEQRFWLEASTFSNRGEMLQHLPTDKDHAPTAGWKPVPHLSNEECAKVMFWYWLPASSFLLLSLSGDFVPGITESIGFQPKQQSIISSLIIRNLL